MKLELPVVVERVRTTTVCGCGGDFAMYIVCLRLVKIFRYRKLGIDFQVISYTDRTIFCLYTTIVSFPVCKINFFII